MIGHDDHGCVVIFFYKLMVTRCYHKEASPVVKPKALRCGTRGRKGQALLTPAASAGINLREEKKEKKGSRV